MAAERVRKLGEDPDTVHVTGCPSIDIAAEVAARPQIDFDPFVKYGGVGATTDLSKGYIVVMQHPVTTEYEEARQHVDETLHAVKDFGLPALWFWPNVDAGSDGTSKGIRVFREKEDPANFHLFRNMFPEDFLRLLCGSTAIVGNSSVGDPRVLVPRRAGREHRQPPAGTRARTQRDRRRSRSERDRRCHCGAHQERQAEARPAVRRRQGRRAHRRLPRCRRVQDREEVDLLGGPDKARPPDGYYHH